MSFCLIYCAFNAARNKIQSSPLTIGERKDMFSLFCANTLYLQTMMMPFKISSDTLPKALKILPPLGNIHKSNNKYSWKVYLICVFWSRKMMINLSLVWAKFPSNFINVSKHNHSIFWSTMSLQCLTVFSFWKFELNYFRWTARLSIIWRWQTSAEATRSVWTWGPPMMRH